MKYVRFTLRFAFIAPVVVSFSVFHNLLWAIPDGCREGFKFAWRVSHD